MNGDTVTRVGILGFGNLGQYLVNEIGKRDDFELVFVWNRTRSVLKGVVDDSLILDSLEDVFSHHVDLIVEVSHPSVTAEFGKKFLQHADFMVGSPTAFADKEVEVKLRKAANQHGCYIPSGAFWGGEDIKKMADRGTLQALRVTMAKHPSSLKLTGAYKEINDRVAERTVLYQGAVRGVCPVAPNNVNTMAVAAIAAHNLGFDKVEGCIIADPSLTDWHIVTVDTWGPGNRDNDTAFHVRTERRNPAGVGKVTGSATFASFLSSMLGARNKGAGVHLC